MIGNFENVISSPAIPIFPAFVQDDTVYGKTAAMQYTVQDKCCGA
jgi:hypothetical protein